MKKRSFPEKIIKSKNASGKSLLLFPNPPGTSATAGGERIEAGTPCLPENVDKADSLFGASLISSKPGSLLLGIACCMWSLAGCGKVEPKSRQSNTPYQAVTADDRGKKRFQSYCAACHQLGGQGVESRVPPLDGSPWVAGPEGRLIRIVLQGLRGPITIAGETYNLEMPAFGMMFQDTDLAELLTYVRRRYGEPSSPITAADVSQVRAQTRDHVGYWTVAELLELP